MFLSYLYFFIMSDDSESSFSFLRAIRVVILGELVAISALFIYSLLSQDYQSLLLLHLLYVTNLLVLITSLRYFSVNLVRQWDAWNQQQQHINHINQSVTYNTNCLFRKLNRIIWVVLILCAGKVVYLLATLLAIPFSPSLSLAVRLATEYTPLLIFALEMQRSIAEPTNFSAEFKDNEVELRKMSQPLMTSPKKPRQYSID